MMINHSLKFATPSPKGYFLKNERFKQLRSGDFDLRPSDPKIAKIKVLIVVNNLFKGLLFHTQIQ